MLDEEKKTPTFIKRPVFKIKVGASNAIDVDLSLIHILTLIASQFTELLTSEDLTEEVLDTIKEKVDEVLKLIVLPGVAFPKAPCNAAFSLLENALSESFPSSAVSYTHLSLSLSAKQA